MIQQMMPEDYLVSSGVSKSMAKTQAESTIGIKEGISHSGFSQVKLKILSILQALEFADYSESAKRKAVEKLSSKIDKLLRKKLTEETALKLGIYAFTLEIIKRGEFDRANEIKEL